MVGYLDFDRYIKDSLDDYAYSFQSEGQFKKVYSDIVINENIFPSLEIHASIYDVVTSE